MGPTGRWLAHETRSLGTRLAAKTPRVDAGFGDTLGVIGKFVGGVYDVVIGVPLAIAVGSPLGEILFRDGFPVEAFAQHFHRHIIWTHYWSLYEGLSHDNSQH